MAMTFVIAVSVALVYFIPALMAYSNKKKNSGAILALNLFLGWTFIGWVVALVWASTVEDGQKTSNANQTPPATL
jgi:hypothetical protein